MNLDNVTIYFHTTTNLPKEFQGNPIYIKQILLNLINNAQKFTHHGYIQVLLWANPDRDTFNIEVTDTGIGIAEEHHEKIFECFEQIDNIESNNYYGTGLGLSVCRGLAQQMDYQLEVQSLTNIGSRFKLVIPVQANKIYYARGNKYMYYR
jgi:two-component system sensor histidine kinase BarA